MTGRKSPVSERPAAGDGRRLWAVAAAVMAAVVLVPAFDALTGRGVYWFHDLRHHHHPWRDWAAREWAAGRVPLWNPDVANGFPLMADSQTGVFYPPNILLGALFPSHYALNLSILLHAWWSGLGAWWLCRVLGRSQGASLLGGLAFALSGFMVAHVTYAGMQAAASWLCWGAGAALLISRDPRPWRALPWAVCAAMALTAGHVQGAAIALLGCLFLFASEARTLRAWIVAGLGAALGIAAASPQLVAALELAAHSAREGGVAEDFAGMGSLPPWELINAVLPRFWGWERPADIALTYVHKGPLFFGTGENHWEDCFYLGLPVVALAGWGLLRPGGRRWKALAAGATLLMLGRFTPVYTLFHAIPGFDFFRFPARFSLLLTLAALALAARGLDDLLAADSAGRARLLERLILIGLGLFLAGALLGFAALSLGEPAIRGVLMGPLGDRPDGPARIDALIAGMRWNTSPWSPGVWWPALLLAAAAALIRARRLGRLDPRRFQGLLLALVTADLLAFGAPYNPRVPAAEVLARPPLLDALRAEGLYRTSVVDRVQPPALDKVLLSSSLGLLYGTRDVILLSPLLLPRNEALLAAAGLDVGMDGGAQKVERLLAHRGIADLLGVRKLVSVHDLSPSFPEIAREGEVGVFLNDSALPRAFVAGCAEPAADGDAALERLLSPGFEPAEVAVVEAPRGALPGCQSGSRPASIARYTAESVAVRAEGPGLLVLADTWYPGWEVAVDGAPAELLRADVSFRGVGLPPGEHEVIFQYRPWWRPLVGLSLLGWPALLLGAGAALLWSRRRDDTQSTHAAPELNHG